MTTVNTHARRDSSRIKGRLDDGAAEGFDQTSQIDINKDMQPAHDDHARFAILVLPHLGDAYSLARWITGSRSDAEDLVQDACLRAFRSIGSIEDGHARPFMLTIVRNSAYTWLSKKRPSAVLVAEDLEEVETAQIDLRSETPETALIAKTDATCLQAAIAALPIAYREALILRDVQGLSYREIAEVISVLIGTVMSRLARGRARVIKTTGRTES
jgi:RNA polymerase sigma factor (sigma-70 family)